MVLTFLIGCSDYEFAGDKVASGGPRHRRDSGEVDTAWDSGGEDPDTGGGAVEDPPDEDEPCTTTKTVRVGVTADDWWEGWLGGQHFGEQEHWWETTWTDFELECGDHVLAIYATDLHQAISGFIGQVEIDGEIVAQTGDGQFKVYDGRLEGREWRQFEYDDSAWTTGEPCDVSSATGWWGYSPTDLTNAGAWWIWSGECLELGDASFRLAFTVQ